MIPAETTPGIRVGGRNENDEFMYDIFDTL
jgi:hypothetical protein